MRIIYWGLMISRLMFGYLLYEYVAPLGLPALIQDLVPKIVAIIIVLVLVSHFLFLKSYDLKFLYNYFGGDKNRTYIPLEARNWSEQEIKQWQLFNRYQLVSIVAWILSEMVAASGYIMSIFGGDNKLGLIAVAVSLVLGLFQRPDFDRFEQNLKKHMHLHSNS